MFNTWIRSGIFLLAVIGLGGCSGSGASTAGTEPTEAQQARLKSLSENRKRIIAEHRRGPVGRRRQTSPLSPHDK